MFSKGNRREEMTTDDADLTGIFRSRRNGRNSGNDERVRTKLYLYSFCRARRRKIIVIFDSQSDWREDIFITEETEIKQKNGKDVCDLTIVFLHCDSAIQACLMAFAALSVL